MTSDTNPTKRRRQGLELLIEVPAVVVTFVMMFHITANALLRTFVDSPLPNTLEITQYWYLPLVAFLGFIAAQYRGQHIAADLVYGLLPDVTKRYVLAVMFVISAVAVAGFAWFGWQEATHAFDIKKTAGVSEVAAWPTYFLVPVAFASLTVQFLVAAVRAITHPEDDHFISDPDDAMILQELAQSKEKSR